MARSIAETMRLERAVSTALHEGRYFREGESTMVRDQPGPVTIRKVGHDAFGVDPRDSLAYAIANGAHRPPRTSAQDVDLSPCRTCGEIMTGGAFNGPWREHRACKGIGHPDRIVAAARALGLGHVEPAVAVACGDVVTRYADVHREPTYAEGEKPQTVWGHVDKRGLKRALQRARKALEEALTPRPCVDGPCYWCGRREDVDWGDYGHVWDDGSTAPLCSVCGPIYDRRGGSPRHLDEQRPGIAEAISGVPLQVGEADYVPAGLIAFGESDEASTGEPWSHLPAEAVERYRWSRWLMLGGKHCPPEHREEAARRLAERDRQRAEAERPADHYGFGS